MKLLLSAIISVIRGQKTFSRPFACFAGNALHA
jgi:hypothetical protein